MFYCHQSGAGITDLLTISYSSRLDNIYESNTIFYNLLLYYSS